MRLPTVGILIATLIASQAAMAQRRSPSELRPGDEVRVRIVGTRSVIEGTVTANAPEAVELKLEPTDDVRRILWQGVSSLEQNLGLDHGLGAKRGVRAGAIAGGFTGLVAAGLVAVACGIQDAPNSNCAGWAGVTFAVFTAGGTVGGGLLGYAIGVKQWVAIPVTPTR